MQEARAPTSRMLQRVRKTLNIWLKPNVGVARPHWVRLGSGVIGGSLGNVNTVNRR